MLALAGLVKVGVVGAMVAESGVPFGRVAMFTATLLLDLAAFVVFALDKQRAQQGGARIPERKLHLLSLVGGAGACLGRKVFRHKTKHAAFDISGAAGLLLAAVPLVC